MPKIPTYQPRVSAPGPSRVPALQPTQAGAESLAKVFIIRGRQLQEQYDTATARVAFNAFRDESRSKLSELVQFKGNEAIGVQDEYNRWYKDSINKIGKEYIKNAKQHEMFNAWSNQSRQTHLNKLADHEIKEFGNFKNQDINNKFTQTEGDVRDIVMSNYNNTQLTDEERYVEIDSKIDDLMGLYDTYFPGQIDESKKQQWIESLRVTQMKEIINLDPQNASKWLEKYRKELGDSYHTLNNHLKSAKQLNLFDSAAVQLSNKYGNNYHAIIDEVSRPKNFKKYGGSDNAKRLVSYFQGLRNEHEHRRDREVEQVRRWQEENEYQALIALKDPNVSPEEKPDLFKLAKQRKIRMSFFDRMESVVEDDPMTLLELDEALIRGEDMQAELMKARSENRITDDTLISYAKNFTDGRYKRGLSYLNDALGPKAADKWDYDKFTKYANAKRIWHTKIRAGEDFEQAAIDVVATYNLEGLKNLASHPRPSKSRFTGDITNWEAWNKAQYETAQWYDSLSPQEKINRKDEYLYEMRNIDSAKRIIEQREEWARNNPELAAEAKKRAEKSKRMD